MLWVNPEEQRSYILNNTLFLNTNIVAAGHQDTKYRTGINKYDYENIVNLMNENQAIDTFVIKSTGGSAYYGEMIGHFLRKKGLKQ